MKKQKGFSLIELLIVVAVIGVLTAIAIPAYNNYTVKSNVVAALAESTSYKTAVALCFQETGGLTGCDAGAQDIPPVGGRITAVTDGEISLNIEAKCDPTSAANSTVVYTPTQTGGLLIWDFSTDADNCDQYL